MTQRWRTAPGAHMTGKGLTAKPSTGYDWEKNCIKRCQWPTEETNVHEAIKVKAVSRRNEIQMFLARSTKPFADQTGQDLYRTSHCCSSGGDRWLDSQQHFSSAGSPADTWQDMLLSSPCQLCTMVFALLFVIWIDKCTARFCSERGHLTLPWTCGKSCCHCSSLGRGKHTLAIKAQSPLEGQVSGSDQGFSDTPVLVLWFLCAKQGFEICSIVGWV